MNIQKNIPLADKNWFQTGGPAKLFCEPTNISEFADGLAFAREHNEPLFVLGKGANILISDDGFDGLVIRPALTTITHIHQDNHLLVTAGAGVAMHDLIEYCLANNILGLEEFSGIPGTVGGSVYINLHYYQFLLAQFLASATVIEKATGTVQHVEPAWFKFGYDYSTLHEGNYFLLNATFKLKTGSDLDIAFARGRRLEIIRHRTARYPSTHTCGSFFRNFHEHEVTLEINNKKMIYVAYYLDKIGVKGALSIGDATVSHQHANMLVNRGNATSTNIIELARTMQKKVRDHYNVIPQPECQLIGFKKHPLL